MELHRQELSTLLKISASLWVIWGLVHAVAGILTLSGGTASAITSIANAVDPATLLIEYPDAVGAIVNQHGFNLLWGGIVTVIGGLLIWRSNVTAIFVSALVGGLFDLGYFIFVDPGGYNKFLPWVGMPIISAISIVFSFYVYCQNRFS